MDGPGWCQRWPDLIRSRFYCRTKKSFGFVEASCPISQSVVLPILPCYLVYILYWQLDWGLFTDVFTMYVFAKQFARCWRRTSIKYPKTPIGRTPDLPAKPHKFTLFFLTPPSWSSKPETNIVSIPKQWSGLCEGQTKQPTIH